MLCTSGSNPILVVGIIIHIFSESSAQNVFAEIVNTAFSTKVQPQQHKRARGNGVMGSNVMGLRCLARRKEKA